MKSSLYKHSNIDISQKFNYIANESLYMAWFDQWFGPFSHVLPWQNHSRSYIWKGVKNSTIVIRPFMLRAKNKELQVKETTSSYQPPHVLFVFCSNKLTFSSYFLAILFFLL